MVISLQNSSGKQKKTQMQTRSLLPRLPHVYYVLIFCDFRKVYQFSRWTVEYGQMMTYMFDIDE